MYAVDASVLIVVLSKLHSDRVCVVNFILVLFIRDYQVSETEIMLIKITCDLEIIKYYFPPTHSLSVSLSLTYILASFQNLC